MGSARATGDPLEGIADAFNATEGDTRIALLREHLTDDAEVVHVHGESRGPEEFSGAIEAIHRDTGRLVVELTGERRVLGRWEYQAWRLDRADGSTLATGSYTARRADDGRVTHLLSLPDMRSRGA